MKKSALITAGSAVVTLVVGFGLKKGIDVLKTKRSTQREEYMQYYEGNERL